MVSFIITVFVSIIILQCSASPPYLAIVPQTGDIGDNLLLPDDAASPEQFSRVLKDDCERLIGLYDRLRSQWAVAALLVQGDKDDHVLQSCARLLATPTQSESSDWITKRAMISTNKRRLLDPMILQRRAYDYIRFGKRLIEAASERAQKNGQKKLETHEYIRFGK